MLEILEFIFSNFWIWLGTVIIIAVIFDAFGNIFSDIIKITKKIKIKNEDKNKEKE